MSAVVLPPVNRLSRSFSSLTSIIERMALLSRSEYGCILRPSAVSLLKRWQASATHLQHVRDKHVTLYAGGEVMLVNALLG